MLTGKHGNLDDVKKGRFKDNPNYLPRFYTPANFEAISLLREQCEKDNISMIDATFRWLLLHSSLEGDRGDGFLVGASSLDQLDQNLAACRCSSSDTTTPLSPELLAVFDKCWELTRPGAFPYWRSYSADMPNREQLPQGASYEANKIK